jgi:hypothetical protein
MSSVIAEERPPGWEKARLIPFNHMPGWLGLSRPGSWSIQVAVAGAYGLGAVDIDVYGHDMRGEHDVTGHPGADRTEERWERERLDWHATCTWAEANGVKINHITE